MSVEEAGLSDKPESGPVVIVLAAGAGARMRSSRSKLLHAIGGHSLLRHVLDAVEIVEPSQLVVVVGYQADLVGAQLAEFAPGARLAVQETPLGTADAVAVGLGVLDGLGDNALVQVVFADMPLLGGDTLTAIIETHKAQGDAATSLAPVEENEAETGLYVFDFGPLTASLADIGQDRDGTSLADVLDHVKSDGCQVGVFRLEDQWQARGVDDRVQLASLNAEYNRRQVEHWMRAGVTVMDPASTWIEADVDLAEDVTLLPGTMLIGATSVARGAVVGPETTIKDSEIGEDAVVARSTVELSVVGDGAQIGPYARLRPGTQVGAGGVVGTFVETKNATIGAGARLGHLTYCGDTNLGDQVDVGASAVFANWDTTNRSRIDVGAAAIIGAGALIVPPAVIDAKAVVPPGATITPPPPETDIELSQEPRRSSLIDGSDAAKRGLKEDK